MNRLGFGWPSHESPFVTAALTLRQAGKDLLTWSIPAKRQIHFRRHGIRRSLPQPLNQTKWSSLSEGDPATANWATGKQQRAGDSPPLIIVPFVLVCKHLPEVI